MRSVLRYTGIPRKAIKMSKLDELKKHLRAGQVYRRSDLAQWSNAVDRHMKALVRAGVLKKLSGGLYYYSKKTSFGEVPPEDEKLVRAFLKDDRFLLTSPNAYNALGVGTTQLYNEQVVYNHKRHGKFQLGGRMFDFRIKPHFPYTSSEAFLLVDLVNNLDALAEDTQKVLSRIKTKALRMDYKPLQKAVNAYAGGKAKNFFNEAMKTATVNHVA